MPENVFVGRENELGRLLTYLHQAQAGHGQIVFIAGEAGAGKSALCREFVSRAEASDPKVVAVLGEANAQTGAGDPYLPFRQILTTLTTADSGKKDSAEVSAQNSSRLSDLIHLSGNAILDAGPDIIGLFVPGAPLVAKFATSVVRHSQVLQRIEARAAKLSPHAEESSEIAPSPTVDQDRIYQQYTSILRTLAKDHTLILIIDDLQWADSSSLGLLFHLTRQLKDDRVMLVGAYRLDDVAIGRSGERHPLESILNEIKRYNGDIVLDLGQAGQAAGRSFVDALVDSEPNRLGEAFRQELFLRTDGHPLFTTELLRHLEERGDISKDSAGRWVETRSVEWSALPARVEGVISERIGRLEEHLHETLTIASVFGLEFSAQSVAAVQEVKEWDLIKDLSRQLEKRHHLVLESGEKRIGRQTLSLFRFSHGLFQQFIYDGMGNGERHLLHRQAAQALEAIYAGHTEEIATSLALHFEESGDDEKAIAYLIQAGDAAFRVYAQKEAIDCYSRALGLAKTGNITDQQLLYLYEKRGRALELSSQAEQALGNYAQMANVAHERRFQEMDLAAKNASATLYSTPTAVRDAAKGETLALEAVQLARDLGNKPAEARALWNLLLVNMYLKADPLQAIVYGEQSLALAKEANQSEQVAYTVSDLAYANVLAGRMAEAEAGFEQAGKLWQDAGNLPMLTGNLDTSLIPLLTRGKYEKMLAVAEQSLAISRSIDNRWNQAAPLILQGYVWMDQGEPAKALGAVEDGIRIAGEVKAEFLHVLGMASQAYFVAMLGAAPDTVKSFNASRLPDDSVPPSPFRLWTLALYALTDTACDNLDRAQNTLLYSAPNSVVDPASPAFTLYYLAKARLAFAQARFAECAAEAEGILDHMHKYEMRPFLADTLLLAGQARIKMNDAARGEERLQQALAEARSCGVRRVEWQILAALAACEVDPGSAAVLHREARESLQCTVDRAGNNAARSYLMSSPQVKNVLAGNNP